MVRSVFDAPAVGRALNLSAVKYHHTMIVTVTGRPKFYRVWLAVSHDGKVWLDVADLGGALPLDGETREVSYNICARYVRAQVTNLDASPGLEPGVSVTIASC